MYLLITACNTCIKTCLTGLKCCSAILVARYLAGTADLLFPLVPICRLILVCGMDLKRYLRRHMVDRLDWLAERRETTAAAASRSAVPQQKNKAATSYPSLFPRSFQATQLCAQLIAGWHPLPWRIWPTAAFRNGSTSESVLQGTPKPCLVQLLRRHRLAAAAP